MSRELPGAFNPTWSHSPSVRQSRSRKVHLRVGASCTIDGPACGNDLRVAARGRSPLGAAALALTDDPERVTCRVCQRSYAFQIRTRH